MEKRELTNTAKFLLSFVAVEGIIEQAFWPHTKWRHQAIYGTYDSYRTAVYRLQKRGWIKFITYKEERFLQLTKRGELEVLFQKAQSPRPQRWDGKWRLVAYDIPEEGKEKRVLLRKLLKQNGFVKFQASIYINPYPLNREAISYLKQNKLIAYIRILKVEEIDDDSDLRKNFNLIAK
jgi:CRISPR-associated endonuclease Cas2